MLTSQQLPRWRPVFAVGLFAVVALVAAIAVGPGKPRSALMVAFGALLLVDGALWFRTLSKQA